MSPINPAALVGHHVVITAAAQAEVPAFRVGPVIFEVTEFYGVTGGEPQYEIRCLGGDREAHDVFLSEVRLVGASGPEIFVLRGLITIAA